MDDMYRFKDGERLAWTIKWLYKIPMLFVTGTAEIKQITGLKRTGQ